MHMTDETRLPGVTATTGVSGRWRQERRPSPRLAGEETEAALDLQRLLTIACRRWKVVVASFVGCVAVVAAYTWMSRPVYKATASLLVDTSTRRMASDELPLLSELMATVGTRSVETQAEILNSPQLQRKAIARLSPTGQPTLVGRRPIDVQVIRQTDIIAVSALSYSPETAAALANAVCEEYISSTREGKRQQLGTAAQYVADQLSMVRKKLEQVQAASGVTGNPSAASQPETTTDQGVLLQTYQMLNEKYHDLRISQESPLSNARVTSPAEIPDSPVRPRKLLNLVLGVMLGIGLAVGMASLVDMLDDRVHSEDDAEASSQSPVLATVPFTREENQRRLVDNPQKTSLLLESYRMLRTNIVLSAVDRPIRSLVITSTQPGEGKTLTAANLAVAIALNGNKVILVDADLRRPSVGKFFGLTNEVGLTSLIAGLGEMSEVLQETKVAGLRVLCSGPIPPNPPELLNSEAARACFAQIKEEADFVVFDTPPALALADAQVVSDMADAVLLVTSVGEVGKRALGRTSELLAQTRAKMLGVVLNKVKAGPGGYYYHSYRYSKYYHDHGDTQQPAESSAKQS